MGCKLPTGCQECKIGQNCDENEKCTTTECPNLSLDNGLLLGNMNGIGNRIKFTCNSGYRTETGESYTTCEETGNWSITPKCVQVTEFWIGLTEMNTITASTTRLWQWLDDEKQASFFDWASGEPNWIDEKCGFMNKPGWHDVDCSRSFQPICETVY